MVCLLAGCASEPRELAYMNAGTERHNAGDDVGALANYDRAIQTNPKCGYCYFLRGRCKFDKGDYAGAVKDCTDALANYTQETDRGYWNRTKKDFDAEVLCRRAVARIKLGDKAGGLADYQSALELCPNDSGLKKQVESLKSSS
jgi:tetratricopeptide (TPR) repeat protein